MKQLSLHVTDLCNSRCSFCVVGSPLISRDRVNYDDLIAFLVANAGQGYESVNLHGGEPTIHPRLFELLADIRKLRYPAVQIQTNGRRLKNLEFAESLREQGVELVVISLHGATASIQDHLTQAPGGFAETLDGIRNAKRVGIRVRTNTVLTRQNMAQLSDIVGLCASLGVDHVNISNLHPVGSGFFALETQGPTVHETRRALSEVLDSPLRQQVRITLEGFPLCVVSSWLDMVVEDGTRDIRMLYQGRVFDNYDEFMDRECRVHGEPCEGCRLRDRCGGVYREYLERRGWSEFGMEGPLLMNSPSR